MTEVRSEAELQAQLAAIEGQIAAGNGDVLALLEQRESLGRAIQAARIRREQEAVSAYRADFDARAAAFNQRREAVLLRLGGLIPQLLDALTDFDRIIEEINAGAPLRGGETVEGLLGGMTLDFATRVREAITESAPRAQWNFDVLIDGKPRPPALAAELRARIYAARRDVHGNPAGVVSAATAATY